MRFFSSLLAGAALVASVLAVEINSVPNPVEVGKTYTIKYSPADNTPTTFILRKGKSEALDTVATLTTSATGGTFQWTVDRSLVNGADYALEIKQGNGPSNYFGPFAVTGSAATSSAKASSSTGSVTSSASASGSTTLTTTASTNGTASITTTASSSDHSSAATSASRTGSPSAASSSVTAGAPQQTGAASMLGSSPVAFILGAVAAMAYLN